MRRTDHKKYALLVIGIALIILVQVIEVSGGNLVQFYINAGFTTNGASNLNSVLTEFGYSRLEKGYMAYGGGWNFIRSRWLFGFDADFSTGDGLTTSGNNGFFSGAISINGGMVLLRKSDWLAFSQFGFGFKSVTTTLSRNTRDIDFDDILLDPGISETIRCDNGIARLTIGLQKSISAINEKSSIFVSVATGADFSIGHTSWRINTTNGAKGPEVDLGGFFLRFSVGGSFPAD